MSPSLRPRVACRQASRSCIRSSVRRCMASISASRSTKTRCRLIRRASAESIVLLFRNQTITSADQRRFASYFGPVAERLKPPEKSGVKHLPNWNDDLMIISNEVNAEGEALGALGQGEMWFHTDKCYVERPHRFSFLYGIEIPTEGGHTKFASLCAAYDRLPEQLKKDFEGKMVMQGHQYGAGRRIDINADLSTIHHHRQPLVVTNPELGAQEVSTSPVRTRCGSKAWSGRRARLFSNQLLRARRIPRHHLRACVAGRRSHRVGQSILPTRANRLAERAAAKTASLHRYWRQAALILATSALIVGPALP